MTNADDRLRSANPVPENFPSSDFTHLYSRAMSARSTTTSFWRAFQLRMAGAVAASAAVTASLVALLTVTNTSLPVIDFAASTSPTPSATAAKGMMGTSHGAMIPLWNYTFTASADLSTAPSSAPAYTVQAPSDLASDLTRVAGALHLPVGTPTSAGDGSVTSTGPATNGVAFTSSESLVGGYASWTIGQTSASPTVTGTSGVTGSGGGAVSAVSRATTIATAMADAAAVSPTLTFGQPVLVYGPDVVEVTVPILIDNAPTSLSDTFNYNASGQLEAATGASFTLTPLATYPLLSPADAVSLITPQHTLTSRSFGMGNLGGVVMYSTVHSSGLKARVVLSRAELTSVTGTTGSSVTGATGTTGASGATGATATTMSVGVSGSTGTTGTSGATGTTGTTGTSGATGTTGTPPSVGVSGTSGATGTTGATGATGTTGATGATGTTGTTGLPVDPVIVLAPHPIMYSAASGARSAEADGVTTSTLAAATGATGATGTSGTTGTTGTTGTNGVSVTPEAITITSATLQYGFFTMSDGTVVALPEYNYTGTPANATYTLTFTVVPIDAQYVNLSNITKQN